jgi:superfamily II DNA helicase RecQ
VKCGFHATNRMLQESGRAGRDGEHSKSILYVSPADIEWCMSICKDRERPKVGAMVEYANQVGCRRAALLSYFKEKNGKCKIGRDVLCDACACQASVRSAMAAAEKRRHALVCTNFPPASVPS